MMALVEEEFIIFFQLKKMKRSSQDVSFGLQANGGDHQMVDDDEEIQTIEHQESSSQKRAKLNQDEDDLLYDFKSKKLIIPSNVKITKQSRAGINYRGLSWLLTKDRVYVWDVKRLLSNPNMQALCLDNVPISESGRRCFVTTLIPYEDLLVNNSDNTTFAVLAATPEGKYKYWYNVNLEDELSSVKFELGTITGLISRDSIALTSISVSKVKNGFVYLTTQDGYFLELVCHSDGKVQVTTEQKAYGSQKLNNTSNEGLFNWLTSWSRPTTETLVQTPERAINVETSKEYLFVLTEKSLSKYTEDSKEVCN